MASCCWYHTSWSDIARAGFGVYTTVQDFYESFILEIAPEVKTYHEERFENVIQEIKSGKCGDELFDYCYTNDLPACIITDDKNAKCDTSCELYKEGCHEKCEDSSYGYNCLKDKMGKVVVCADSPDKECVFAKDRNGNVLYDSYACGYNCAGGIFNAVCAETPEQECKASNDGVFISCGYNCIATKRNAVCADAPDQECKVSSNGTVFSCGYNCLATETQVNCAVAPDHDCKASNDGRSVMCGYNCLATETNVTCANAPDETCICSDINDNYCSCGHNCRLENHTPRCD